MPTHPKKIVEDELKPTVFTLLIHLKDSDPENEENLNEFYM